MLKFGVIGYGYWGPNVVRNLTSLEGSQLLAVADVMPIHYGTFPRIEQDAQAWAARVMNETPAQPVVLQPGDWFEVPRK